MQKQRATVADGNSDYSSTPLSAKADKGASANDIAERGLLVVAVLVQIHASEFIAGERFIIPAGPALFKQYWSVALDLNDESKDWVKPGKYKKYSRQTYRQIKKTLYQSVRQVF